MTPYNTKHKDRDGKTEVVGKRDRERKSKVDREKIGKKDHTKKQGRMKHGLKKWTTSSEKEERREKDDVWIETKKKYRNIRGNLKDEEERKKRKKIDEKQKQR